MPEPYRTNEPEPEPVREPSPEPIVVQETVMRRRPRPIVAEPKPQPVVETKPKVEELLERLIEVSTKKTRKVTQAQTESKPKTPKPRKSKTQDAIS